MPSCQAWHSPSPALHLVSWVLTNCLVSGGEPAHRAPLPLCQLSCELAGSSAASLCSSRSLNGAVELQTTRNFCAKQKLNKARRNRMAAVFASLIERICVHPASLRGSHPARSQLMSQRAASRRPAHQLVSNPAACASQLASPNQPDRAIQPAPRQPVSPASQPASRASPAASQPASQPASLLYASPAEARLTVYRRSQHFIGR